MAKIIKNFSIDLSDMAAAGGDRAFSVVGDIGAIFSLEIKNEDSYYYNFTTSTFSASKYRLKQQVIGGNGKYSGSITFPSVTDDDQYDIYLWAESAYDTIHGDYYEVRFGDDSLDINSSTGSNSNLLQKVIYQYTDTTITIQAYQQTLGGTAVTWLDSYVTDTIVVPRGKNSGKQSFSCTVTTGATEAIQILRQPQTSDFFREIDVRWEPYAASSGAVLTGDGPILIQGEDIWAEAKSLSSSAVDGQTRGSSQLNMGGGCSEANKIIVDALPGATQVGDRLTGWLHDTTSTQNSITGYNGGEQQVVTISRINPDGDNANEFSIDTDATDQSGLTIADNKLLYFNAPYYYRYKTKASIAGTSFGVLGLKSGLREVDKMKDENPDIVIADGGNRPNTLSPYEDSTTYTTEVINNDGSINEQTNEVINISYPAIDTIGFKPTITNGKVVSQDGILTFSSPQKIDTAVAGLEGTTWFLARGLGWVKELHNTEIKVTNLKVELTKPTTTTTSGVSDSVTIPVADREGTIINVSTIDGIGIGANNTDTVDGAVANATKIVLDNNVAGQMKVGDRVTGIGIPSSSTITVEALNPDGDNVKEFSISEAVIIADGATLTFIPQSLPVITSSTADGAGSWTVDVTQTLENGATLTVENTGRTATITGDIEVVNCGDSDFTLILDCPNFLTGA